jgi:hypothetical protein
VNNNERYRLLRNHLPKSLELVFPELGHAEVQDGKPVLLSGQTNCSQRFFQVPSRKINHTL